MSPERNVTDNVLTSSGDPAVRIAVKDDIPYLGEISFDLKGLTDTQIFFFVDSEGTAVKRMLTVHFERFHDHVDEHYWDKQNSALIELEGVPYQSDVLVYNMPELTREDPESDTAHMHDFLAGKDLVPPDEVWRQRLFRPLGEDRKAEILIILSLNPKYYDISIPESELVEFAMGCFEVIELPAG